MPTINKKLLAFRLDNDSDIFIHPITIAKLVDYGENGNLKDEIDNLLENKLDIVDYNKVLSTHDFTNELKDKLDNIEPGANKYSVPLATEDSLGGFKTNFQPDEYYANCAVRLSNDKAYAYIDWNDINTTNVIKTITDTESGLMPPEYKSKLDNIEEKANKYILPIANETTLGGIKTDYKETEEFYAVKLDDNNAGYVYIPFEKFGIDILFNEVTDDASGLMPIEYKKKLDGIEYGANDYRLLVANDNDLGGCKVDYTPTEDRDYKVEINNDDDLFVHIPWIAVEPYTLASSENNGLMSKEDKIKLDTISTNMIDFIYNYKSSLTESAGANHNAIYRGKEIDINNINAVISDTSFADLYLGDYFNIGDKTYTIAGFDTKFGFDGLKTHHIELVDKYASEDSIMIYNGDTLNRGYLNTYLWITTTQRYNNNLINQLFFTTNLKVVPYTDYLSYNNKSGTIKTTVLSNLLSERELFGSAFYANDNASCSGILPLFSYDCEARVFLKDDQPVIYWLHDIADEIMVCGCDHNGDPIKIHPTSVAYCRYHFLIGCKS